MLGNEAAQSKIQQGSSTTDSCS